MDINLLQKLCSAFGVSGDEKEISDVISDIMINFCDKVQTDDFGNLYCFKGTDGNLPTVMLDAHLDSVGLIVKEIYDDGFLSFETVGGIDAKILSGLEVVVNGKEKIKGIISSKPPHLMNKSDEESVPEISSMFIDVAITGEKLKDIVSVGDLVSFSPFAEKMGNCITGTYLDNRAGCMSIIETFAKIKDVKLPFNLVGVFTRQEEIGLVGAGVLNISPDLCIVIDVTHGMTPDEKCDEVFKCGDGTAIGIGPNVSRKYYDYIKDLCDKNNIKYQTEVLERSSGTNAWKYQLSNLGVPCAILSIPLKFMHTSVETASVDDYENLLTILELILNSINVDFIKDNFKMKKISGKDI